MKSSNVKAIGDLSTKLSSKNKLEREYATFAAMKLDIDNFEQLIVSTLSDEDNDPLNTETLEQILKMVKSDDSKNKVKIELSKLYSMKAENLKDVSPINSEIYAKRAIENFSPNAQARYRLGRLKQEKTPQDAIKDFEDALKDLDDPQAVYSLTSLRPDLRISIFERMGESLDAQKKFPEAKQKYEEAKKLMDAYSPKDDDDNKRLAKISTCINLLSQNKSCLNQ